MEIIVKLPLDKAKQVILDNWHKRLKLKTVTENTIEFRPTVWWAGNFFAGKSTIQLIKNKDNTKTKVKYDYAKNFRMTEGNLNYEDRSNQIEAWLRQIFYNDIEGEDF